MDTTSNLSLPYIMPSQAQKHVTHNEALAMLDALVQLAVLDRTLTAPSSTPNDGDRHIVAAGASGVWTGQQDKIAAFQDGAWIFFAPQIGWRTYVADEDTYVFWDGAIWKASDFSGQELQNVTMLGVGTEADVTNPFAAKVNKALWTAMETSEGGSGDLRYTLNKETAGNVLSLLLQSGYAGRAEIGLVGNDDLVFRVSADGTSWKEVLRADSATGAAIIGNMRIGRDSVQNLLPDSGRFNGNANNSVFNGIGWSAPTYLSPVSGCTIASYARFIHDNSDYGGVQPALNANVKELIEKIRPSSGRRYGPEWYVMKITQSGSASVEPQTIAGLQHGIVFANSLTALPEHFTIGYYIKVESGTAAIRANNGNVKRLAIDGVEMPAGTGAAPAVIGSEDGWKYVNLQSQPNAYAYDVTAFQLLASADTQLLFAMPKIAFGHVDFDPDQGVLMNSRMFG